MNTTDRWLIHRRLAEDTNERLAFVNQQPQHITLIGADADISRSLLAQRYPKARFREYDPRADFLAAAAAERKGGLLAKLAGKTVAQSAQSMETPLPEAQADMLWANLSLICANEPVPVFDNWARHLKTNGLLFFTHFGGDSLQDLRQRLSAQGHASEAPILIDMHDLGDMLFHHGFYDPVMDTATLELSYRSVESFWQDMETLGLWRALKFVNEAAAREAVSQMWQSGELSNVRLETVYGHAVKKLQLPENERLVQFYPLSQGA